MALLPADNPGYYVVLDLRFFHLLGQLRCHVSMSIWSAVPRHRGHRPDETPQMLTAEVAAYQTLFDQVATAAETLLERHGFVRADGSAGDGAQGLPLDGYPSAGDALRQIQRLGLRVGMTPEERHATLALVGEQLRRR